MNNQDQIENIDDSDELKNSFDSDSLDMNVSSNIFKENWVLCSIKWF